MSKEEIAPCSLQNVMIVARMIAQFLFARSFTLANDAPVTIVRSIHIPVLMRYVSSIYTIIQIKVAMNFCVPAAISAFNALNDCRLATH